MLIKSIKLNMYFVVSLIVAGILVIFTLSSITVKYNNASKSYKDDFVVIIDAGHGGVDPGAIGVNKCKEKDINLAISLCLKDILIANGYEVIMTRETDVSINDPKYTKIAQIKTSDLKNRLKIIESHNNAIAVSIHQNEFTSQNSNGAQMFYGKENPLSKTLAESIQKKFVSNLQANNKRQIKRSTNDVYIVHNAKNPIVLAECGFISNYHEAELLTDKEYQQKVAFTIFTGIVEWKQQLNN